MTGEERHERCRYGRLTEAFWVDAAGRQAPTVLPLCAWQLPEVCPPAVRRIWGGNTIETEDCAACPAYDPL